MPEKIKAISTNFVACMEQCDQMFFALLRSAMTGVDFDATPTADDWATLYQTARKQSLAGVVYTVVTRLDKSLQPPMALALQWLGRMVAPWQYTATAYHLYDYISPQMCALLPAALLGMGPLQALADRCGLTERWKFSWLEVPLCAALLALCLITLASSTYNPFIYFKF